MAGRNQHGPRGEKVTVVTHVPHDGDIENLVIEVFASAGVRPGSHKSAADRVKELEDAEASFIKFETIPVK